MLHSFECVSVQESGERESRKWETDKFSCTVRYNSVVTLWGTAVWFFGSVVSTGTMPLRFSKSLSHSSTSWPRLGWSFRYSCSTAWHCDTPGSQCQFCGRRDCYTTKLPSYIFKASPDSFSFYIWVSFCTNSHFACKCEGDGEILAADGKKKKVLQCLHI